MFSGHERETIMRRVGKLNNILRCNLDAQEIMTAWETGPNETCSLVLVVPCKLSAPVACSVAFGTGDASIVLPDGSLILTDEMGYRGNNGLVLALANIKRRVKNEDGASQLWLKTNRQDPDYRINEVESKVAELTVEERAELLRRLMAGA